MNQYGDSSIHATCAPSQRLGNVKKMCYWSELHSLFGYVRQLRSALA